jgi:hypothetical protein
MAGMPKFMRNLPSTQQFKLNSNEHEALKQIRLGYSGQRKTPSDAVGDLIMSPTPALQSHIDNTVNGDQLHAQAKDLYHSAMITQAQNRAAGPAALRTTLPKNFAAQHPQQAGFGLGGLLNTGGIPGFIQRTATEAKQAGVALGPSIYDVGKHAYFEGAYLGAQANQAITGQRPGAGVPGSQGAYFKQLGEQQLHQYGQILHHPIRQLWDQPFNTGMALLPFITGGAGTVLKGADILDTASALRAGEISPMEAATRIGSTIIKRPVYDRKLVVSPTAGPHIALYHGGPSELESGYLKPDLTNPENEFYGGRGVFATDHKPVADSYAATHVDGTVHELHVPKKSIADVHKELTPAMRRVLQPLMGEMRKGTTLDDVFKSIANHPSEELRNIIKPVTADELHAPTTLTPEDLAAMAKGTYEPPGGWDPSQAPELRPGQVRVGSLKPGDEFHFHGTQYRVIGPAESGTAGRIDVETVGGAHHEFYQQRAAEGIPNEMSKLAPVDPLTLHKGPIPEHQYLTEGQRMQIANILAKHAHLHEDPMMPDMHIQHTSDIGSSHMTQVFSNEDPLFHGANFVEDIPAVRDLIDKYRGEAEHYELPQEISPSGATNSAANVHFRNKSDAQDFAKEIEVLRGPPHNMDVVPRYVHINPDTEGEIPDTLHTWKQMFTPGNAYGGDAYGNAVLKDLEGITGKELPATPKPLRQQILEDLLQKAEGRGHDIAAEDLRDQLHYSGGSEVGMSYPTIPGSISNVPELDTHLDHLIGEYGGEVVESGAGMGSRDYSIQFRNPGDAKAFMKRVQDYNPGAEIHGHFPVSDEGVPLLGVMHNGLRDEGGWLQSTDHPDAVENLQDWLERNQGFGPPAGPQYEAVLKDLLDLHRSGKFAGKKATMIEDLHRALSSIGIHGVKYPTVVDSEDIANNFDIGGIDPNGPEAEAAYKGLDKASDYKLWHEPLLKQAMHRPYDLTLPPAKSSLGMLLQKHFLDPATEAALRDGLLGVKPKMRMFGRDVEIPNPLVGHLQSKYGKFMRRDREMRTQIERGKAEVQVARELGMKGPYDKEAPPAKIPERDIREGQMHPSEAQRIAYGQGSAQVHAEEHHNLYNGLSGPNANIMQNLKNWVAIKKPGSREDFLKNSKAYNSPANEAREWDKMVVEPRDYLGRVNQKAIDQIRANPHDYAYMPYRTWHQYRPRDPSFGIAQKPINTIDNVTQLVRSGRFLHPGYIAWAVQNGILHLSQAGMYTWRNASWVKNEWDKLSPEAKAEFDNASGAGHYGGGITRATEGSPETKLGPRDIGAAIPGAKKLIAKAARFWHAVDDAPFRRMSLAHELHRYLKPGIMGGKLTAQEVEDFIRRDPAQFRAVARQGQREAIDYSEMSPMERATFQKLFTAWGWTRGATTWAGRFPFQHPFQASIAASLGENEAKKIDNYYMQKGGAPPDWLAGSLPIGRGNSPWLLAGGDINPFETAGQLLGSVGGLTKDQTQNLQQLETPTLQALEEIASGRTQYGQQIRGNVPGQALSDLAKRFEPWSAYKTLTGSKKGGGTFAQGPAAAALQFGGVPLSKATNIKETAALGLKDLEQAASAPDAVRIRTRFDLQSMPQQARALGLDSKQMGSWRGDIEAKEMMQLWQLQYASQHGAKSYKSLPAMNKYLGSVAFSLQHHYMTQAQANQALQGIKGLDDNTLNTMATANWDATTIGTISKAYEEAYKAAQPVPHTPARP